MSTLEPSQTILITAAGGHIGSYLVPMLLKDETKPKLVLLSSNASRLRQEYAGNASRVVIEEESIEDTHWVESQLKKHRVTSVCLCLTGENELFTTMNFFSSLKRADCVKHLVYVSACNDFSFEVIRAGALKLVEAAHVTIGFLLQAHMNHGLLPPTEKGGFSRTILGPTLFFDNDLHTKSSVERKNFFDKPLSPKGQSRVAPSNIALAAYKSLVHDRGQKYHGHKIMIGSKHAYTHAEIVELWSKSLGRDIRVLDASREQELDELEAYFRLRTSPVWARDIRLMYGYFAATPFEVTEYDFQNQVVFLGKEPEEHAKFVKETAAQWLAEKEEEEH